MPKTERNPVRKCTLRDRRWTIGVLVFLGVMWGGGVWGQSIAEWSLATNGSPTYVNPDVAAGTFEGIGLNTITFNNYANASGWSTAGIDTEKYYQISASPDAGYSLNVSDLEFGERRSGTGIRDYQVRYSLDNFATSTTIATVNVPDNTSERSGNITGLNIDVQDGQTITFRFYGYNAVAAGGTWRIVGGTSNPVKIKGTVSEAVTTVQFDSPSYTVSEDGGPIQLCVDIAYPGGANATTVDIVLINGDAADLDDYTTEQVTFPAGSSVQQCVTVDITDNSNCDGDAQYTFELQNVTGGDNAQVGTPSTAVLTVEDDEQYSGTLFIQDFDNTPTIWPFSGDGDTGSAYGKTGNGRRIGGNQFFELAEVSVAGASEVQFRLNTATPSVGGIENADALEIYVALNGGTYPAVPDISIQEGIPNNGSDNKTWDYSATGVAQTTAGAPAQFFGDGTTGYATVLIDIPNGTSAVKVKIKSRNNKSDEYYNLDNASLVAEYCLTACTTPGDPTTTVMEGATTTTTSNLSWASTLMGGAEKLLLVMAEGALPNTDPTDQTFYVGDADYGSGAPLGNGFVIANKENIPANNNLTASSLEPGTLYGISLFGYNCFANNELYSANGATAYTLTRPENASSFKLICSDANSAELSWDNPSTNHDGVVVVARQNGTPTSINLLDPDGLSVNPNFSLGSTYGTGSKVVYKGSGNGVMITGLTAGNNYVFKVIPYVDIDSPDIFKYASGTQITVNAGISNVSNLQAFTSSGQIYLQWQNPALVCYDSVLVALKTSSITAQPSLNDYTVVDADFGNPSNPTLSDGSRVLYYDVGNGVTLTGLVDDQEYCAKVFVRFNGQWSIGTEVCQTVRNGTFLAPGDLMLIGADNNTGDQGMDRITLVNLVELTPGTNFNLANMVYEYKAEANVSTGRWYSGNDNLSSAPSYARITYEGDDNIPAGSIWCIDLVGSGSVDESNVQINGAALSSSEVSVSYEDGGSSGNVAISSSKPDALFLTQGTYSNSQTDNDDDKYVTFVGRVLGAIQFGGSFQPFSLAGNAGGPRISREYPTIECIQISSGTSAAIYYAYYNGIQSDTHYALIASIADFSNWSTGTGSGGSNELPSGFCTSGFTVTGPGVVSGQWTGASSNDWFACENWSNLAVPDQTTDVVIPNVTNDPSIGQAGAECRDLEIETSANVIVADGGVLNIYGNVLKDGSLLAGGGSVAFRGLGNQYIGNSFDDFGGFTYMNELIMDKPSGKLFSYDNLVINTNLDLHRGLITLLDEIIHMEISAGATTTNASNESFVDGRIQKVAYSNFNPQDLDFTFPIGDTTDIGQWWYQPVRMFAPPSTDITSTIEAQYFAEANPHAGDYYDGSPHDNRDVGKCDYWKVDKISGDNVRLAFKYTNDDPDYCNTVNNANQLSIVRWNDFEWDPPSVGVNPNLISHEIIIGTEDQVTTQYGQFALASSGGLTNVLPIKLLTFEVYPKGQTVIADWTTASETNNDYFTVERSADGHVFEPIGEVDGAGNSTTIRHYSFADDQPLSGVSYYRLRQTDYDGKYEFGPVRAVSLDNANTFGIENVYRSEGGVELIYRSAAPYVTVEIFDPLGQRVFGDVIENYDGRATLRPHLVRGIYILRLSNNTGDVDMRRFFY